MCVAADVTVLVGERGVNNTFVFKGIHTHPYDGFAESEFFDVRGLQQAIAASLEAVEHSLGSSIREIYVGVPGEFCKVATRRHLMSFQSKRRITAADVAALFDGGYTEPRFPRIRSSAVRQSSTSRRTSAARSTPWAWSAIRWKGI